jgi:hypothetical protein
MHANHWQIPLKRLIWVTFLMAVCSLAWARANLQEMSVPAIVVAAVLQVVVFLIAIRMPGVYSRNSAVWGLLTLFLFFVGSHYAFLISEKVLGRDLQRRQS